jgi:hypothetical protein
MAMPRTPIPLLSKSRFTSGLQCHKKLFFSFYERDFATPVGPAQQALFDSGNRVGVIAHGLRPGGTHVDNPAYHHDRAVERTVPLLGNLEVPAIYEAAFTELDTRIRADILARTPGGWDLIEVKSSTSAKPEHVPDAGIQLLVLEEAGLTIERVYIAHIDRDYVYQGGDHLAEDLLKLTDITDDARAYAEKVPAELEAMRAMLAEDDPPAIGLGSHCKNPYQCEFYDHCRGLEPDWSIEELPRLSPSARTRLRDAGYRSIHDIPAEEKLTAQQSKVRSVVQSGRPEYGSGLVAALDQIATPAHFIDFETMNPALPVYLGTRPYQVQSFQWSDHVLETDGSLEHAEFLADGSEDPRREFVETLLDQLRDAGTIVVYSSYEATRLRDLQELYTDLSASIDELLARPWIDLLQVVRDHVYHPEFHGSFSIKKVLPALVPEFSYDDLDIQAGDVASIAYLESVSGINGERREQLRAALLTYCERDTEAMVRIVEALRTSI